jgi:hypothetical protein
MRIKRSELRGPRLNKKMKEIEQLSNLSQLVKTFQKLDVVPEEKFVGGGLKKKKMKKFVLNI